MFLEIEQLRKSYGTGENKVEVLKGIQLGVEKGKICVLLGPSGSGKSAYCWDLPVRENLHCLIS